MAAFRLLFQLHLLLLGCVCFCLADVAEHLGQPHNKAARRLLIQTAIDEEYELRSPGATRRGAIKSSTQEAVEEGAAREILESVVRRAEKMVIQSESTQGTMKSAEEIVKEQLRVPGTLLNEEEMAMLYEASGCKRRLRAPTRCSRAQICYRSAGGTCNNLQNPLFGAANTPFARLLPPQYEDGISQLRGTLQSEGGSLFRGPFSPPIPSARLVSLGVVRDRPLLDRNISHMLMQWGQYVSLDLGLAPTVSTTSNTTCGGCAASLDTCAPISVPGGDPTFTGRDCLPFSRSASACDRPPIRRLSPREQLNGVTSLLDGSQLYGSAERALRTLRVTNSGRIRTGTAFPGSKASLPCRDNTPTEQCRDFMTGDSRTGRQTGLAVMQTLWLREHNRIADELGRINPHWSSERVFQTARHIVVAEMQKITYMEYLPQVMGKAVFDSLVSDYRSSGGYDSQVDPTVPNAFIAAAHRFGHSLVQPFLNRLDEDYRPIPAGPLSLLDAFRDASQYVTSNGTDPILRGLLSTPIRRSDEYVTGILTNRLFETRLGNGMDLAALNVQRGRDHGLPPYQVWRGWAERECGLAVADIESGLTHARIFQAYGSLDTADLWIGGLAEESLPNALIGPTFSCIFAKTFSSLRSGDRFYFENVQTRRNPTGLFTIKQKNELLKSSLSRIVCDNSDNIHEIQPNSFRTDQARTPCSQLPALNLMAWRSMCLLKVAVNPQMMPLRIGSYSTILTRSNRRLVNVHTVTIPRGGTSACLLFQCPQPRQPTGLCILPTSSRTRNDCVVRSSSFLPPNMATRTQNGIYVTNYLHTANITSGLGSIFYENKQSCSIGSAYALAFRCGSRNVVAQSTGAVPPTQWNSLAQKDGEQEMTLDDPRVPDIVRDLFLPGSDDMPQRFS